MSDNQKTVCFLIVCYFKRLTRTPVLFAYTSKQQNKNINGAAVLFNLRSNYFPCNLHDMQKFTVLAFFWWILYIQTGTRISWYTTFIILRNLKIICMFYKNIQIQSKYTHLGPFLIYCFDYTIYSNMKPINTVCYIFYKCVIIGQD